MTEGWVIRTVDGRWWWRGSDMPEGERWQEGIGRTLTVFTDTLLFEEEAELARKSAPGGIWIEGVPVEVLSL